MPTRSRTSSKCAGSATRGSAAGGGRTTIAPTASTPWHASVIDIGAGTIAAGAGGNLLGGFGPLFFGVQAKRVVSESASSPSAKIFTDTLETKFGFHNFPVATAGWPGRLRARRIRYGHRSCPVPLVTILLFGGSGHAHL